MYSMNFLDHLKDYIDINKYYKKINSFDNLDYKNIINYLNIQWIKISREIDDEYYSSIKLKKNYSCDVDLFSKLIKEFIGDDYALGIFFINSIERYI